MPSKTFQPLLFDAYKYKTPSSTYVEHYGKRIKRKEFSLFDRMYPKYTSQKEKSTLLTKRTRPFTSHAFLKDLDQPSANSVPKQETVAIIKKSHVNFDPNVLVKEISQRASTTLTTPTPVNQAELSSGDQTPHPKLRSPPPPTQSDEKLENVTEKLAKTNLNYHWMVYPQEETPNYIIEAKKRLGQIKQPHISPKESKPPKAPEKSKEEAKTPEPVTQVQNEIKEITKFSNKHWLQWENPSTPDNVANIRRRLGDDRYRRQNLPPHILAKAQNAHTNEEVKEAAKEVVKVEVSNNAPNCKVEETVLIKEQFKIPDAIEYITTTNSSSRNESKKVLVSYEPTSEFVHAAHVPKAPYYQIANTFNNFEPGRTITDDLNEYNYEDSGNENSNFILPAKDLQSEHVYTLNQAADDYQIYDQQRTNDNPRVENLPFQQWVQTASEQDKDAVLKILKSIEDQKPTLNSHQSEPRLSSRLSNNQFSNYHKITTKPVTPLFSKKRVTTPSKIRKLGVTRNNYQAPEDENLEKFLIKHSLWSNQINGPATVHFGYNN